MNTQKIKVIGTCKICIHSNLSRKIIGCNTNIEKLITKLSSPTVNGRAKLIMYGTLEIGEVPSIDLMISTMPSAIKINPNKNML